MKAQGFKITLATTFFILFLIWLICSFLGIPYEDGTSNSFISKFCYNIAEVIIFSFHFWYKFSNTFFALFLALFCSALTLSVFIYSIINFKKIRPNN